MYTNYTAKASLFVRAYTTLSTLGKPIKDENACKRQIAAFRISPYIF